MIIGVVSLARGGKDTMADYLVSKYGYEKVNTADVLVDALIAMGREPTKDNKSLLADEWRKESGRMDIVTLRTFERVNGKDNLVIASFRSKEESDLMREKFPGAVLVSILTDKEVRYARKTSDDPQDKKGFFGRDERDIKNKGLANVIMDADNFIDNNGTLEEFYRKIDKLMEFLANKHGKV